jgi:hypothetical protein
MDNRNKKEEVFYKEFISPGIGKNLKRIRKNLFLLLHYKKEIFVAAIKK